MRSPLSIRHPWIEPNDLKFWLHIFGKNQTIDYWTSIPHSISPQLWRERQGEKQTSSSLLIGYQAFQVRKSMRVHKQKPAAALRCRCRRPQVVRSLPDGLSFSSGLEKVTTNIRYSQLVRSDCCFFGQWGGSLEGFGNSIQVDVDTGEMKCTWGQMTHSWEWKIADAKTHWTHQ